MKFIITLIVILLYVSPIYAEEELLIPQLQVGDRIGEELLWRIAPGMASKLGEGQEVEVVSISEDKTQMTLELVNIQQKRDEEITTQEFYNRTLNALEKK